MQPALELALEVARAGLAADPPVPPPSGLRRVLSFSRTSGTAWATVRRVVDADADFRSRVADAADPDELGRAPWLWLTRPDGWEAELDELVAESASALAEGDLAAEVASLRRKLAGAEQAARRHEAAAAEARAGEDALRARLDEQRPRREALERRVADLANDLESAAADRREAVRNLKQAESDLTAVRAELRGAEQVRREAEAALRDLRADAAARAPAVPAPPASPAPESRTAPVDLARLRTAVADAGTAAAALGSALADAAAAIGRPADTPSVPRDRDPEPVAERPAARRGISRPVRRPSRLPGGVFEESPAAAHHLLRLPGVIVLVDGYNVAKTAWTDVSLEEERRRLVQLLERVHLRTRADFLVVFDGSGPTGAPPGQARSRTVRIRFSPAGVPADDVVRDLVDKLPADRPVVVVSSDREVAEGARARGANVLGSRQLLDAVR